MDFRGGSNQDEPTSTQNPSSFYNSATRIRKAYGSATWKTDIGSFGIGAGQEFTIVAPARRRHHRLPRRPGLHERR